MAEWTGVYELQYERIAQHENQRLAFSSLVIAITTGALAFISSESKPLSSSFQFLLLISLLLAINITAIVLISKSRYWIKLHQERAKQILIKFSPDISDIIDSIEKANSDKDKFRRPTLQKHIHIIIIAITLFYALDYSWPYIAQLILCK